MADTKRCEARTNLGFWPYVTRCVKLEHSGEHRDKEGRRWEDCIKIVLSDEKLNDLARHFFLMGFREEWREHYRKRWDDPEDDIERGAAIQEVKEFVEKLLADPAVQILRQ